MDLAEQATERLEGVELDAVEAEAAELGVELGLDLHEADLGFVVDQRLLVWIVVVVVGHCGEFGGFIFLAFKMWL
jgi:hypothetical protein